ncbi:hypothetical protein Trco_003448 [Trichoderma cornu-damae]|uniref:Zn(2)-C6 fungal-type domain-containing protein n=1 Tax=Trichoderma cornu-damae TaxID=654480 RepID=A0A9P8QKM4_9HYPO|nr:hypothetical protein Trco_003448 [Trichoderma cornu-damae]
MASQFASTAPLPQGFSVYQPQLGAQLQFFPALGTQELDDMMNAYIPGSASLQEKRATISLDFLEHIQLTGQTFKFYHVHYSPNPAAPVAASPVGSVAASSFSNASPVNSTWGWSQASASPSTPSHSSTTKSRKSSRASSSASRYATADLSHLPGMKIMTKDGLDVTNTASRGSKTKEQRDHAHMMRIMKACDSCRRKKIRCDPSHKTQSALQTQPQAASRRAKKAHKAAAAAATALLEPVATGAIGGRDENSGIATSPLGLDPTFTFAGLDSVESTDSTYEAWENFIQYPPLDMEENYDFFFDPKGYLSPQTPASLSASPHKPPTPSSSQQELLAVSGLVEREATSSESSSPQLLFPQDTHHGSVHGSTDSNPFSPSYSFSEDSRMVSISSTRPLSPSQPSASRSEMVVYNFDIHGRTLADEWSSPSAPASPVEANLGADADTSLPRPHDPDHGPTESREQDSQAGIRENTPTDWLCGVSIAHAPARSVLVTMTPGSDDMGMIATSMLLDLDLYQLRSSEVYVPTPNS